jgi:hypothetical protein
MEKNRKKFHGLADKVNCTFWWIIYLDPQNPQNNAQEIQGYSKFQNYDEAKDKEDVLMAKCEMLYKNGYLNRATHIEIYQRKAPIASKQEDPLIITLYHNDYRLSDYYLKNINWRIRKFLQNFYDAINGGRPALGLRPLKDKEKAAIDDFDINNYNFKTYGQLYTQADKLISLGNPPGRVQAFIAEYIRKKFDNKSQEQLVQMFVNSKKNTK